jgi:uncharacterized protein YkwD
MPLRPRIWIVVPVLAAFLVLAGAPASLRSAGAAAPAAPPVTPTAAPATTPVLFMPTLVRAAATAVPTATPTPTLAPPSNLPSGPSWLVELGLVRAQAKLAPLAEDASYSDGCLKHGRYMVKNSFIGHTEDPANPYYTPEGAAAAAASNVATSSSVNFSDVAAVDLWMAAPFHGIGILDPRLQSTGFGNYHEAGGPNQSGACLDVIRGLGSPPPASVYPVMWPGAGSTVNARSLANEFPDPLSGCPGFSAPAGLPIYLQLGNGSTTPRVTASSLLQGTAPVAFCIFDETTYTNPDAASQSLGRQILGARDAIVMIPRAPLSGGATYRVSITVNGQVYAWTFAVSPSAQRADDTGEVLVR